MSAQTTFRSVANSQFDAGASDAQAMRVAWGAVKEKWKKDPTSDKWIAKVGARHTRSEFMSIQNIHDEAVRLGASCATEEHPLAKATERNLYVKRTLLNAEGFAAWARSQGFVTTMQPGDLHVTVARSSAPLEWPAPVLSGLTADIIKGREVCKLGDTATVLKFKSPDLLARWDYLRSIGSSWDFDAYMPHITISSKPHNINLEDVAPYKGPLIFGPEEFEEFEEVNDDWQDSVVEKIIRVDIAKVDSELGIVFGWAIVSTVDGEDYYDVQGDNITENAMLHAMVDYMKGSRIAGNMHRYNGGGPASVERVGTVVFGYPLTAEIAKSLGISAKKTGALIGMQVDNPEILQKFKSGEYTGFSIGGQRITDQTIT
jgi:Putative phage serine protease XkdF/ChaB